MITHYVLIAESIGFSDIVVASKERRLLDALDPHWIPVEDAKDFADAAVRAREFVEAIKALEEPKPDIYNQAVSRIHRNVPGRVKGY